MKSDKLSICILILSCLFLTSCGRKMAPKPAEGSEITYPRPYPKPEEEKCTPQTEEFME